MTNYRDEFPDFSAGDMPAIPEGFEDLSWHNDVCPSFERNGLKLWVDYLNPNRRELKGKRFTLTHGDDAVLVFATDEWVEMSRQIAVVDPL